MLLRFAALVFAIGCDRAPPSPPSLALLEVTPISTDMGDYAFIVGRPGAAPSRVELFVWNLDLPEPATLEPVSLDGSFLLEPRADEGHVLRMVATEEGASSTPVDFVVAFGEPSPPPITECLRVPLAIDDGTIAIENACEDPFALDDVRARAPDDLAVDVELPIEIAPGGSIELPVEGQGEIALLFFGDERRAVSVR